jgi:tRNA threonylcarbamoyladenosine biosynthesis protein TsaE
MMEFIVYGSDALPSLMNDVLDALDGRKKVVVHGEMGAGKTTFISAFCEKLGVKESPASPTYSLVNEYGYTDADGRHTVLRHLDLYRLQDVKEALDLGIDDMLHDDTYCFIEWPVILEGILPENTAKITIEVTGLTTRRVIIE